MRRDKHIADQQNNDAAGCASTLNQSLPYRERFSIGTSRYGHGKAQKEGHDQDRMDGLEYLHAPNAQAQQPRLPHVTY